MVYMAVIGGYWQMEGGRGDSYRMSAKEHTRTCSEVTVEK